MGALPAAVQVVLLWGMPETPRWLVKAGKKETAKRVLGRVYGAEGTDGGRLVKAVLRKVEREILEEEDSARGRMRKGGWSAKLDKIQDDLSQLVGVGGNRRALIIACLLQGAQQLCGFVSPSTNHSVPKDSTLTTISQNSLMYFSATIFSLVGFRSPTLTSLSIALTNFLFTLVAFHYIDRIGRRRILLLSLPVMILGLTMCAIAFNFLHLPMEAHGIGAARDGAVRGEGKLWPAVILAAMVTYVAGYAVGMGNVPWQQSELVIPFASPIHPPP